ncbi:MAG: hypothetical protein ABR991_00425 [Terracidiphilus sp.]|jgi:hypothetical protein
MSDLKPPRFATEAEEAEWWFRSRDLISVRFHQAAKAGRQGHGGGMRLLADHGIKPSQPLPTTTIRLDPEDIAKARQQAADRGLRYQTYLKMMIHEALRNSES